MEANPRSNVTTSSGSLPIRVKAVISAMGDLLHINEMFDE
jgi:hypothetical protein